MTDPTRPPRTPFADWLIAQHLRDDEIGALAASMRGDIDDPNPADLDELRCYLVQANATADRHVAATAAWSAFLAEQHDDFALELAVCAERLHRAHDLNPGDAVWMPIAELLDAIGYASDATAAAEARAVLLGLAPDLLLTDTRVRVEGERVMLAHDTAAAMTCLPRYGGAEEAL